METGDQTVLITGATGGIGYEISKLFAREKFRIVIVGPEAANLHNVSEVLKTLGAAKVHTICKNFSSEKAADEIYQEIQAAGLKLDVLVNSATAGQAGKFTEVPVSRDLDFLHQNIAGPSILCKYFLKEMIVAGSGSVLCMLPLSLYELGFEPAMAAAAKSFMLSLTDSLIKELNGSPVLVSALVTDMKSITIYNKNGLKNFPVSVDEAEDPALIAATVFKTLFHPVDDSSGSGAGSGEDRVKAITFSGSAV